MSDLRPLCPPAPPGIPASLAKPGWRYRWQVLRVLGALFLVVLVYLLLLGGASLLVLWAVWMVYVSATLQGQDSIGRISMAALGIAFCTVAATLLVYLVKSFLSRAEDYASRCLEVTARTQPELFQFVREVCREIGCAMPKRVYLSHEVNAAVSFPVSGWRLIVPPPKSLLIGLGLVGDLNLVEFKALLAHELGHFSQQSLNLNGFIAVAHCVVRQLVFARDRWDEWLLRLSETPWLCAVAAPPYIVVGMARSLLGRVFYRLSLADLALRRQMEFHADRLAVSVAGSDAPVHLLLKCDFQYACQQQTLASLAIAARYGQYSSNLWFHQRYEAQRLRDHHQDPRLGQPPELPADPAARTQVFSPEIETVAAMWADHPSHYDREQNAKRCYYRSPRDDRPASLLFRDLDGLWEQLSQRFYRRWLRIEPDRPLLAAAVVQEFVDDEQASLTVAPRYHGVYDNRCLELDDLDQLIRDAEQDVQPAGDEVRVTAEDFYSDSLRTWVETYHQRQSEFAFLNMVHWGECCPPDGELDFRGRRYLAADAGRLLLQVHEELERDRQHLARFDASVFRAHLRLARNLGQQEELCERYRCCRGVQDLACEMGQQTAAIESIRHVLASRRQFCWDEAVQIVATAERASEALERVLEQAAELRLPPLKHIPSGERLRKLLPDGYSLPDLGTWHLVQNLSWLEELHCTLQQTLDGLTRLHQKSLVGLLAFQERLARDTASNAKCADAAEGQV